MIKNTIINLKAIQKVATALGRMNEKVVFVGGAVVSLYADDPAAEDVRPTKDIDLTFLIASLGRLEEIRQELIDCGFYQSHEDNVICRFRFEDLQVDVMATKPIGWAPANTWFEDGFQNKIRIESLTPNIWIMPLIYFLASKFEAFNSRGGDPRTSRDFEDIVYLLAYCRYLQKEFSISDGKVRHFLTDQFNHIRTEPSLQEAILAHLFYEHQTQRFKRIMKLVTDLCNSSQ